MNPKRIVKLSNIIGIISILLLIYWVFVFISTEVFGLRVFQRHITETFAMSIMGILALMAGALMINIMFNLTRIADKQNDDNSYKSKNLKKLLILFALSFPLIFGLLVGGDYLTKSKKEKIQIATAEAIISNYENQLKKIADYEFNLSWAKETSATLTKLSAIDSNFSNISVLVQDEIDEVPYYLGFGKYISMHNDSILYDKLSYVHSTNKNERDYLASVFSGQSKEIKFNANEGSYELFYPYIHNGKTIVLFFTDYQRYGKIGS